MMKFLRNVLYYVGFCAGSEGMTPASTNRHYCKGYAEAVFRAKKHADEVAELTRLLRKAEAHVTDMHARTERVKKIVADSL